IPAADHLNDHSLQQFVNNLTNQPVRFRYEAFGFEGNQVGVICIEEQTRPIYLKRDYGKLKKQEVYVRRGSSTDPTKPASLEEIAQMRVGAGHPAAELVVEFANVDRDDSLGASIAWDAELCQMPEMESIPDLARPRQRNPFGIDLSAVTFDPLNQPNASYFRDLANYEFARRLFRSVRLVVKNVGEVAANNVRAELTVPTNIGAMVIYESDLPDPPKRRREIMNAPMKGFRSVHRRDPGEVTIDKNDERFRVEIDCHDLQPGRRVWSDIFYIGKGQTGDLPLCGQVFADNLPQPKDFALIVSVNVTATSMSVNELCSLPELAVDDD
ncbi:MAG TPA: hypothetical protein VFE62_24960, partial [Gemmataceae bacterium]|nr:hypothetical protein [Gemmataceae bacterium]